MKKDIKSSKDIQRMVDRFYDKIKADKIVGFIFNDVMKVNWDKHLPILYAFWENALFYTGSYKGNAMKKHININRIVPLQKKHFTRWLLLFNETVDEYFLVGHHPRATGGDRALHAGTGGQAGAGGTGGVG